MFPRFPGSQATIQRSRLWRHLIDHYPKRLNKEADKSGRQPDRSQEGRFQLQLVGEKRDTCDGGKENENIVISIFGAGHFAQSKDCVASLHCANGVKVNCCDRR